MATAASLRFMLYSHDGMGLGHVRRNLAIASALIEAVPQASVLLASGSDDIYRLGVPANVEVLKLPGLRKQSNEQYVARTLHIDAQEILRLRANLLTATVQTFRPHVLLVDKHPLGASGELRESLRVLKCIGGRAVLGLRDILDDRATVLAEWYKHCIPSTIVEHYDRVLVYGDHRVLDPVREYRFPSAVGERTWFCGYVVNRPEPAEKGQADLPAALRHPRTRPVVLATAGGGEDGCAALSAFVCAARGAAWKGVVVTGPLASPGDQMRLQSLVHEADVDLYTSVNCLCRWFPAVDALVTMGGYNTVIEAISSGTPTVCVPRVRPRQEQLIRARAFARLGLLQALEPAHLTPTTMHEAINLALQLSRKSIAARARDLFDFRGAQRAALHLLELAEPSRSQTRSASLAS